MRTVFVARIRFIILSSILTLIGASTNWYSLYLHGSKHPLWFSISVNLLKLLHIRTNRFCFGTQFVPLWSTANPMTTATANTGCQWVGWRILARFAGQVHLDMLYSLYVHYLWTKVFILNGHYPWHCLRIWTQNTEIRIMNYCVHIHAGIKHDDERME